MYLDLKITADHMLCDTSYDDFPLFQSDSVESSYKFITYFRSVYHFSWKKSHTNFQRTNKMEINHK